MIAPKRHTCAVPLTVFWSFFLKCHEKWFTRVTSVFQHLNRVLISVFVFRPNCKPTGRCRGWGLAIQVTFWLKLSMIIEIFLSLGSLCSLDSCAAHGVHVILPSNIYQWQMKKNFFIIKTKLLIVEAIFGASRMSQFWEAFCVWQSIAIIQFLGKALEFVSIFLGVYKNQ